MTKTRGIAILAVAAVAGASLVAAQPAFRGRGERGEGLGRLHKAAEFLDLTEDQRQQARELLEQARPDQQRIREQMREHGKRLRELMSSESPDPTAVGEATIAMHQLREETRTAREAAKDAFEALLTPEQLRKWEVLEASRITGGRGQGHRRRGRGPGGPPEGR